MAHKKSSRTVDLARPLVLARSCSRSRSLTRSLSCTLCRSLSRALPRSLSRALSYSHSRSRPRHFPALSRPLIPSPHSQILILSLSLAPNISRAGNLERGKELFPRSIYISGECVWKSLSLTFNTVRETHSCSIERSVYMSGECVWKSLC